MVKPNTSTWFAAGKAVLSSIGLGDGLGAGLGAGLGSGVMILGWVSSMATMFLVHTLLYHSTSSWRVGLAIDGAVPSRLLLYVQLRPQAPIHKTRFYQIGKQIIIYLITENSGVVTGVEIGMEWNV